jgi:hypothetical protein
VIKDLRSRLTSRSGFSLTEIVVATGVVMFVILGIVAIESNLSRTLSKARSLDWLHQVRTETWRTVKNNAAWANTLVAPENASTLSCVINKTPCNGAGGLLALKTQDNSTLAFLFGPDTPPGRGLTMAGEKCDTFDPAGNPACPFRFQVRWDPVCIDPTCRQYHVQVSMEGAFEDNDTTGMNINAARFNFSILRDESKASVEDICLSVGGTYDPETATCNTDLAGQCPPNWLVVGFTDSGGKMCGQFTAFRCPAGQVLTGVSPAGVVTCTQGCDPASGSSSGNFGDTTL